MHLKIFLPSPDEGPERLVRVLVPGFHHGNAALTNLGDEVGGGGAAARAAANNH